MAASDNTAAVAYSYIRFSTPAQADGDSVRRQTEAAEAWCERNGVALDRTTTLRDLGASAYLGTHRSNPDRYALAGFLKLVESGKIPRGSALVVESLDRLTREHIRPALSLLLNLIEAGVRVVQLKPREEVYDDKVEPMALMMAIMELSRGHSESAVKSDRVGRAWARKKELAREGKHIVTKQVPAWIQLVGGKFELVPDRAAVVKRIFKLAAEGFGFTSIVAKLNAEEVPAIGDATHWGKSYVARIVTGRRALGEYQPCKRDGTPDGDPIANYFPAVVTPDEFHAAQAAVMARRNTELRALNSYEGRPPRRTRKDGAAKPLVENRDRYVNVFAGLIRDGIEGDGYVAVRRNHPKRKSHPEGTKFNYVLVNANSRNHGSVCRSFPYPQLERAVLEQLAEVKTTDVLGGGDGPDETLALEGELKGVEARIGELETELMQGDVAALARVLRQLETRKADLAARLAEAQRRAASPLSEAWGNCRSLLAAVESAADGADMRVRLRSALRRVAQGITVVVVARGRARLCAAQINFTSGITRTYLIGYDPPRCNNTGQTRAARSLSRSFATSPGATGAPIDLRKLENAQAVEQFLTTVDVEKLFAVIEQK